MKKRGFLEKIKDYFELRDIESKLKRCRDIPDSAFGSTLLLYDTGTIDESNTEEVVDVFEESLEERLVAVNFLSEKIKAFDNPGFLSLYFQRWISRLQAQVEEIMQGESRVMALIQAIKKNNVVAIEQLRDQYKDRDKLSMLENSLNLKEESHEDR